MIIPTQTVRAIAIEHPHSIRVFERFGIDYCCGGRKPLTEACVAANLPVHEVLAALHAAAAVAEPSLIDWSQLPLDRLIAHIVSTHADWNPCRPWWLTGRFAAKWQSDQFEGGVSDRFNAQLVSGRVIHDITEKWDLGVMGSVQMGQYGAQQYAMGLEAGYLLKQNLWLSLGFNHTGFVADRDLAGYEYTQQGVYLRLRFKFDQNLFAGDSNTTHRTPDH